MIDTMRDSKREPSGASRLGRNTWQYALVGVLFGTPFPVIATGLRLSQARLGLNAANFLMAQTGDPLLWMIDTAPLFLGLLAGLAGIRQDALAARNTQLQDREGELTSLKNGLEQRVAQRTDELAVRNTQLRAAVDLTRELAEIREASNLASRSVELFAERFPGYLVELHLVEASTQTAVLQASSERRGAGNAGAGRSVRVGDPSLVGQAALLGRVRVGPVIQASEGSEPAEPGISGHRGEIALPLNARGQVLGVLSLRPGPGTAMGEMDRELLQLLADQLAAGLDRARLLEEARASLLQLQAVTGQRTREGWQEFAREQGLAFRYAAEGVRPIASGIKDNDQRTMRVPLVIRGHEIGALAFRPSGRQTWSDADRDLAEKAATQVALALENNRLLEETRQRAFLEQRVSEISDRFSRSIDMDSLLQTAVRELAALPEVTDASVFVSPGVTTGKADDLD